MSFVVHNDFLLIPTGLILRSVKVGPLNSLRMGQNTRKIIRWGITSTFYFVLEYS